MDLTRAADIITAAAKQPPGAVRVEPGRWDGSKVFLERNPDNGLDAENAAGPLTPGQRVLCLLWSGRVAIIGPSATTLEARLAQLEARLARLPYRVAHGQWVEPDPGPTSSFIRFPPGALFTAPPTVVTQLASPAGVYSGARALVSAVGTTGFQLSTVGTATARCPWNWIAIQ